MVVVHPHPALFLTYTATAPADRILLWDKPLIKLWKIYLNLRMTCESRFLLYHSSFKKDKKLPIVKHVANRLKMWILWKFRNFKISRQKGGNFFLRKTLRTKIIHEGLKIWRSFEIFSFEHMEWKYWSQSTPGVYLLDSIYKDSIFWSLYIAESENEDSLNRGFWSTQLFNSL